MQEENQETVLIGKLKCSIIRDLFSQVSKNIKSEKKFFLRVMNNGIKMIFLEAGKETEIEILLHKDMFSLYQYEYERVKVFKFDIREFENLGILFDNPAYHLQFHFMAGLLLVSYQSQFSGSIFYEILAETCSEELVPPEIWDDRMEDREEEKTKIIVSKTSSVSHVLHTLGLMKVDGMHMKLSHNCIHIQPITQMMGVMDFKASVQVKVEGNPQILRSRRFSVRRFKSGLSLLDKNGCLIIELYSNFAKLSMYSKQKKDINIYIAELA